MKKISSALFIIISLCVSSYAFSNGCTDACYLYAGSSLQACLNSCADYRECKVISRTKVCEERRTIPVDFEKDPTCMHYICGEEPPFWEQEAVMRHNQCLRDNGYKCLRPTRYENRCVKWKTKIESSCD